MGKRLAVGILGGLTGGLLGWLTAIITGWTLATGIGFIVGGLSTIVWAEKRGTVPTVEELQRPRPLSLSDQDKKR